MTVKDERAERLAAALRANLRRRKDHADPPAERVADDQCPPTIDPK